MYYLNKEQFQKIFLVHKFQSS